MWMQRIDKSICDEGYTWNPSNCKCECNKYCDAGKHLDYLDCKCKKKKKIFDPLFIKECTKILMRQN